VKSLPVTLMIFCGASEDEKEVLMNSIRESAASIRS
jgi:hypothetical protein